MANQQTFENDFRNEYNAMTSDSLQMTKMELEAKKDELAYKVNQLRARIMAIDNELRRRIAYETE